MSCSTSRNFAEIIGLSERVFLDTNPIIYLLNGIVPYNQKVKKFIIAHKDCEFYTSTITDVEFLVRPYRDKDFATVQAYMRFTDSLEILKCFITDKIADCAARIRAKYKGIKLGDALQLASSIECGCNYFLTNDLQLKQVAEANVVYLGDL